MIIPKNDPVRGARRYMYVCSSKENDMICAVTRTGLKEAPVNGKASSERAVCDKPIAIGAVRLRATTERSRLVFVRIVHVMKKVPKASKVKAEVACEP